MFPPATRLIFRNQVIDAVRAAILDGRLQPGQPITERPLAHDLQISRAPIREALREREPDAARRTGYDCNPLFEFVQ